MLHASRVVIEIEHQDDRVSFCVEDDGCGFDVRAVSSGLRPGEHAGPDRLGGGTTEGQAGQQGGTRVVGWVPARTIEGEGA